MSKQKENRAELSERFHLLHLRTDRHADRHIDQPIDKRENREKEEDNMYKVRRIKRIVLPTDRPSVRPISPPATYEGRESKGEDEEQGERMLTVVNAIAEYCEQGR